MFKNILFLLAIGAIWGSQFVFQEMAVAELAPIWVGTGRAVIGALTLILLCQMLGLKGQNRQWLQFALIGLLEAAIPFFLIPWGQESLNSSVAAVLMGSQPFYAVLLAPLFLKGARISRAGVCSVLLGFCGLLVLFYPSWQQGMGHIEPLRALAILVAACCFAIAILLVKRIGAEQPLIVARNILIMASIELVILGWFTTPLPHGPLSIHAWGALLYLGVMCAGVVYYFYMCLINQAGPVFTSMTNYIVPAIGVLIGTTLNNESINIYTKLALIIILSAVAANQYLGKRQRY